MSDPVVILGKLRSETERLDKAGKGIFELQQVLNQKERELAAVIQLWDETYTDLLTALVDSYEEDGKRTPAADIRHHLVLQKMREEHGVIYGNRKRLEKEVADRKNEINNQTALAKKIEKGIESYRSQLSWLKTEVQATG